MGWDLWNPSCWLVKSHWKLKVESPFSDGFDTKNYDVGNYKKEIESEFILDGNYPRKVINRLAPAYFTDYAVDMYDALFLTL